ncbi:MAG: AMP-binding protein, partial [Ktedonobacteraceae bacterium]|nr:AMP-binding protein [Ktedonobacteraceae bacterium]
ESITAPGRSLDCVSLVLDDETATKIDHISSAYEISADAFLLACWQSLIWFLTRRKDFTIYTLCKGRRIGALREALGAYACFCPIRSHIEPDYRFTEMIDISDQSVRSASDSLNHFLRQESMITNDGLPADRVNAVGFEYEEWPEAEYAGPVEFSYWKQSVFIDRFKLKLGGYRRPDGLTIEIQYDPAAFSWKSAESILERYHDLIENALECEQALICDLDVVDSRESEKLLANGRMASEGRGNGQAKVGAYWKLAEIRETEETAGVPPLVKVPRKGPGDGQLPLSFAQQRLWFLDQLAPNNPFYNIPSAVRSEGRLNLDALERVINEIVRRHEVLRTRFEVEEGIPVQVIDRWEPRRLEIEDLTGVLPDEREEEVSRLVREEAETGFDLSRGPLLRVKVLRLGEERHVLLYTMHHIVSDAWSTGILMKEVGELYRAYGAGEESPLEELPIQYGDFAVWQREWLRGDVLERELEYWRRQLEGMEDLELPTDHPRPATQSFRGVVSRFVIEREITERLRTVSRLEGATLFMVLLGGFDLLMSRYSGQSDVVIGTDIANRNRAEIEGLIGFFVNQLVLRVKVEASESFKELLVRVRRVCLEAYEHQDLPFEKLVEELQPERDLSRSPLFQAKLMLQNATQEDMELGGAKLSRVGDSEVQTTKLDLTVAIMDTGRDMVGVVNYSQDIFETETIEHLMSHYCNLLRGIVENGEKPMREQSLLSDEEREQIVVEWNRTRRPYPQGVNIHELLAGQAGRRPERIALISEGRQVSYGELNQRANRVGNYLRRLGVGPEVVVGLCLERSVEVVVGMLGVLKAGGAYLPLDAEWPLERVGYVLEESGTGVVLTERKLEGCLPAFWGQTVLLDEE